MRRSRSRSRSGRRSDGGHRQGGELLLGVQPQRLRRRSVRLARVAERARRVVVVDQRHASSTAAAAVAVAAPTMSAAAAHGSVAGEDSLEDLRCL